MKKVSNYLDIKKDQIVLFFDTSIGKIRGFDQVLEIKPNGDYTYKTQNDSIYNGNLKKLMNEYSTYIVSEEYLKYSDKALDSACLSWDSGYVFTDVLNPSNLWAKATWNHILTMAKTNIEFRVLFIDLTEKYQFELHLLNFQDTQNNISDFAKNKINNDLAELVNKFV